MVAKRRTQSRFSFRVRMKRSTQPLPSGSRTKAGELAMPRKASSGLVVIGDELAAVIVAQLQAAGDPLGEGAEAGAHALTERLERLEAGRAAGGVDAQAFGRGVIHRDEDRGLALAGQGRGQIGGPHLVDPLGADGAVVGLRAMRPPDPAWRLETMLAGQAQDAPLGGADAGEAQPCPDLPIALTVERAVGQQLADRLDQRLRRASARAGLAGAAGLVRRIGDDDTAWPAMCPRPGSPAGRRKAGWWRARLGGSWPRPPPCQRAASLQALDLGLEQLGRHGQVTDLGLEAADLEVTAIGWPGLERRLAGRQEGVAPSAQLGRRHPELARHQLQRPRRAAAATPRSACAWPTSAGAAQALARLRQRVGRAPPGQRPVPSCPSCSPPCTPSSSTRRCLS